MKARPPASLLAGTLLLAIAIAFVIGIGLGERGAEDPNETTTVTVTLPSPLSRTRTLRRRRRSPPVRPVPRLPPRRGMKKRPSGDLLSITRPTAIP